MSRILENLKELNSNYIFPFFWQHGEDEATLREYMKVIDEANIKAVCVESRPHPDFAGPKWWEDMDIILEEARKRNMKVWILDDAHFPTGMANGKMADADAELCKLYINYRHMDICGPIPSVTLDINAAARYIPSPFDMGRESNPLFGDKKKRVFDDDRLLRVIASRLDGGLHTALNHVDDSLLDITSHIADGTLKWDVPKGMWRIFVIYQTRNGGGADGYINMVDKNSCRVLIDAVYEPHYSRYQEEFGKTIAGFFSDEPCFGNVPGFDWDNIIGKKQMPLPWSAEVGPVLEEKLGSDYVRYLPALWGDAGSKELTAGIRIAYMDTITELMQKDFGEQIGEWCRQRGVEYIGHIVEDNNASEKLGSSMGHFFRALWGQDMSGIDDIGGQIMIGGENVVHNSFGSGTGDGEFYHNVLAKLGSSLGHIDPKKRGRCMCEAFGAYGWKEGTTLMKYITDHLIVRGVNRFVPHAFSPRPFPDFDCPPHFYANGENPLYRPFGQLMKYMNRLCHIFDGGHHIANVALLYHAEAQWSGGDYMLMQKPARVMAEGQIDFDIIPCDVFRNREAFGASFDGRLHINDETFDALVIARSEFLPEETIAFINAAGEAGFPVIFIDGAPKECSQAIVLTLEELVPFLRSKGICNISVDGNYPRLRFYHYVHEFDVQEHIVQEHMDQEHIAHSHIYEKEDCFMFSNEDVWDSFIGEITLSAEGTPYLYDAVKNELYLLPYQTTARGLTISLKLEPFQSAVVVVSKDMAFREHAKGLPVKPGKETVLDINWKISFAENKSYPNFTNSYLSRTLEDVNRINPDFSGIIRYEGEFDFNLTGNPETPVWLRADYVYEAMEVWCNEVYARMVICPPYEVDLSGLIKPGKNVLRIEVFTTLERKAASIPVEGPFAFFSMFPSVRTPNGIVGEVRIFS